MKYKRILEYTLAILQLAHRANGQDIQLNWTDYNLLNFLQDIRRLHHYDQLVFAHNRNATFGAAFGELSGNALDEGGVDFESFQANRTGNVDYETEFVRYMMTELPTAVVLYDELSSFELKRHFSAALLIVVYLEEELMAQSALFKATTASCETAFLRELFQFSWHSKMINVAALCNDYQDTQQFYSYTHLPDFALEYKHLSAELLYRGPIFPYRLSNWQGYKLPYIIGGGDPRVIVYEYDRRRVVGGFAGHFLVTFAHKYNFTLYEPLPIKSYTKFPPSQDLIKAVRNNTVEISVALTFPNIPLDGFSYPYEQVNWCVWTPVEADIPNYDFFWIVFEGMTFLLVLGAIIVISLVLSCALWQHNSKPDLLRFVIHDACLRGVIGQSFRELSRAPFVIRFIYMQIYVLGILLTTSYNAYFAAYWTSAPKVAPLRTFDDILQSNKKIYMFAPEYNELIGRAADLRKYIPMFYIESDYHKYLATRDAYDTKYLYMIPTTKWRIYREQQKVFTTPIFRLRADLCFYYNIPLGFPIHSNSVLAKILQDMVLETAQSGLTDYWMRIGFWS
ncbi:unnamed protein product [Ceratitis capitata]|uniref:(Mediterranean fruit fly) hypothetical protein n=1 Tax=Ceratitis capitata TaxID=7213 RepID=A0A811TXQ1_CERCA|nr:unnamed protein product [Ceratitis capitata]